MFKLIVHSKLDHVVDGKFVTLGHFFVCDFAMLCHVIVGGFVMLCHDIMSNSDS